MLILLNEPVEQVRISPSKPTGNLSALLRHRAFEIEYGRVHTTGTYAARGRKDASAPTGARENGRYGSNLLKQHGAGRICLGRSQGKQEARAVVKLALGANRSAVCQNNMLRDGKPQPCPAGLSRASFIDTVETLEKARQMFGRNARPKVS